MNAGALGGLREEIVADGVNEDSTPEGLEILESAPQLRRSQAPSLSHASKGGGGLDVGDGRGSDAVGIAIGVLRLLGSRLVDQQLDQGAGVEIETQRRPSET